MIETNLEKELTKEDLIKHLINAITIFITGFIILIIIYEFKLGFIQEKNILTKETKNYTFLAPILFIIFQLLQIIIPIIPGGTSSIIGVIIFGPVLGFIYNYIGIITGSILAYKLSKKYGLKVIKIFFKEETIKKYINYITDNNFKKIFILGMFIPFLPDDLLCYLAGISNIKTKTFLYSICITKFFTIILYSLFLEII